MCRAVALLFCVYCVNAQSLQETLKEAVAAQQSGKLDQAIHDYRFILEKYPNIPEIRSNLGAALAGEGHYSEAITEYERALKLKANPQVRLNLALAYYKTGNLTAAVDSLKRVRDESPTNLQAVTLLADCYLRLGQNKEVVDLLTSLQRMDPGNRAFNYLLGTALVRDGQVARGQLIIDKVLKDGDSAEARLLMGTTKYMAHDFPGALTDFQKAVELNPSLPEAHAYYGLALLGTGDQASAKQAFEQELKSDPNNFEANLRMGVLLRQDEENEAALKYLRHALQVRPGDPGVRYQMAVAELSSNHIDQACRDLEALVKDHPDFLEAHVSLATVYFRQKKKNEGERERAIIAKLNAVQQANDELAVKGPQDGQTTRDSGPPNSDTAESRFQLGSRIFQSGDYPAAVKQLANAIELNPKLPGVESLYGQALLNTGDSDAAAEAFRNELAFHSDDFPANLGLGQILTMRKHFKEAIPVARRALQLRPESAEAKLLLAECLSGSGQFGEARPYAEAVVKAIPNSVEAHQTLATIDNALHLMQDAESERKTVKLLEDVRNANTPGPKLNESAPDFALPEAASGKIMGLRDFHGKSPVVVVFGSYTCPNFRWSANALKAMQERYGSHVSFLLVYIREAHAIDNWQSTRNLREGIMLSPATTLTEKQDHAMLCSRKLHLPFPALVDGMDGAVEAAYHAWPSRVFVIGYEGRVLYSSRLTEWEFHPEELESILQRLAQNNHARDDSGHVSH